MAVDIAEIVLRGTDPTASVSFVNTFHYSSPDPAVTYDLTTLSASFITTVLAPFLALVTTDYICTELKTTIIFGPHAGQQFVDGSVVSSHGANGASSEDYAYALVVRRGDGTATREGRGRLFVGPVKDTYFDVKGFLIGTTVGLPALEAALLVSLNSGTAGNYTPCLFHRNPPGVTPIIISGHSFRAGIRKHRRYKPA